MTFTDLEKLLLQGMPEPHKPPVGFLELAGQSHREVVITSLYASFLNRHLYPELAGLFSSSLLELINEAFDVQGRDKFSIEEYEVHTEWAVGKERIDILITDDQSESAVLIENKIYHFLANKLLNYWDGVPGQYTYKSGVILALEPTPIPAEVKGKFVCITHRQWIDRIKERGLPLALDSKVYVYVNDFFNTLMELSKELEMDDNLKFYYDHKEQIIQANALFEAAKKFVCGQLSELRNSKEWDTYGNNSVWIHLWPKGQKEDIVFVIGYPHLYHPQKGKPTSFEILIQLGPKALNFDAELLSIAEECDSFKSMSKINKSAAGQWKQILLKSYPIEHEAIAGWVHRALEKIEQDFRPLYNRMRTHLAEKETVL